MWANDFSAYNHPAPANRFPVSATGSRSISVTSTYRVGMCLKFRNTQGQLAGDRVNSWFMITNS